MKIATTLLLLAASLPGQRTWIVNCTAGPGVDFTDLPPAVAAASPGDTILLAWDSACSTIRYSGAVIDKPLSLIGVGPFAFAGLYGLIEVRGIPSGQHVLISSVGIACPYGYQSTPHGIYVHDCNGEVHLEQVNYFGDGVVNGMVHFVDCANVTMHWCELYAPGSPVWVTPNNLPPAPECSILFRRTTATLVECRLGSEWPSTFALYPIAEPADAVRMENSNVTLVDTMVRGAGSYVQGSYTWWWARFAVVQDGGQMTIGPGTQLYGGRFPTWMSPWVYQDAIWSFNNGTIVQDPLTYDTNTLVIPPRQFRVVPAVLMERAYRNRSYLVRVRGLVGDFALLGVAGYTPPGTATPYGQLLLDPSGIMIVGLAQIPAAEAVDFTFTMHPAVPMDLMLGFQAGLLHGNGAIELSLPAAFSVLWEPGRTWP